MKGNTSSATYFRTAVNGVCSGTLNLWTSSRVNMVEKKDKERTILKKERKKIHSVRELGVRGQSDLEGDFLCPVDRW